MISEAFLKCCQLLHADGHRDIVKNGVPVSRKFADWNFTLDPEAMQIKLEHKDFPIGLFGVSGGALFSGAENDFINALDAELKRTTTEGKSNG